MLRYPEADYYALGRAEAERAALLAGYGRPPADPAERLELYRLYHALELWNWFRSTSVLEPLDSVAAAVARLAG